jgi:hypothetical protein
MGKSKMAKYTKIAKEKMAKLVILTNPGRLHRKRPARKLGNFSVCTLVTSKSFQAHSKQGAIIGTHFTHL